MIKVIFSDMDGTLLDESGKLPAEFDEVAAELERRSVLFAPASGRQYYSLIESFPKYVNCFLFFASYFWQKTGRRSAIRESASMRV